MTQTTNNRNAKKPIRSRVFSRADEVRSVSDTGILKRDSSTQPLVRTGTMVISVNELAEQSAQLLVVNDDDVIEQFPSACADEPLHTRIRTRRAEGVADFFDPVILQEVGNGSPVDCAIVPKEESVADIKRHGFAQLLDQPELHGLMRESNFGNRHRRRTEGGD